MSRILPNMRILYEEGPCLVVLKPAGILTQAPTGIDNIEDRIKELLKRRDGRTGDVYLGVPHRLDRPVSGAMVFGKHVRATRRLADQFEARRVKKVYWALTQGHVTPDAGTWEDSMRKVHGHAQAEIVPADDPGARAAILRYRVIGANGLGSWLQIELETGRTHQVRLQAASRGWPLLGDQQYGATEPFGQQYADERLRAIALHARVLGFRHPVSHGWVEVTAPLSTAWRGLVEIEEDWAAQGLPDCMDPSE
jgi:23S rRNA pseudouridine1911/1915/1917 synthase